MKKPHERAHRPAVQKVDFSAEITDMDGKAIMFGDEKSPVPLTLGRVVTMSLLAEIPEQRPDALEVMTRWSLAQRIHGATELVDLKAEEVVLVRRVIEIGWSVLVRGRAYDLLPE